MRTFFTLAGNILPELTIVLLVLGNLLGIASQSIFPFLISYLAGAYWYYFLALFIFDKHEWHAVAMKSQPSIPENETITMDQNNIWTQNRPEYFLLMITILCTPLLSLYLLNDREGNISHLLNSETLLLVCLYSIYAISRLLLNRRHWLNMSKAKRVFEIKMLQTVGMVQVVGTIGCIFAVLLTADIGDSDSLLSTYVIIPIFGIFIAADCYRQYKEKTLK